MKLLAFLGGLLIVSGQAFAEPSAKESSKSDRQSNKSASQDSAQGNRSTTTTPGRADEGQGQGVDRFLAGCVAAGNQEEVAFSQFGAERAQNPKVKEFCQKMIKEHTDYLSKLRDHAPPDAMQEFQWSGGAQDAPDRAGSQSNQNRGKEGANDQASGAAPGEGKAKGTRADDGVNVTVTTDNQQGGADVQASGQNHLTRLGMIGREEKQRCLDMTIQNLQSKDSQNFDKAFMGCQVSMHTGMVAKLQTYQQHAQGDLKQVFAEGAKHAQQHLDMAKNLMKELDPQAGGSQRAN